jgi:predicted nucleotidyltransferase
LSEAGPKSDLDVVVELDERTFDRYMDLKLFLEELFGCRVDLVLVGSIKPRLRSAILGEAVYAAGL